MNDRTKGTGAGATTRGGAGPKGRQARIVAVVVTAMAVVAVVTLAVVLWVRANRPAAAVPPAASPATLSSGGNGGAAPAAAAPGAASTAPAGGLDAAADAVGFRIISGSNVGIVENMPADTLLMAPSATLLPVGAAAPDFTLSTPRGERVRLSDYRGRTVLLEFFATWCPHCQAEAPHLLVLFKGLPADTFAFLSVNGDSEDAASVHAFGRHFSLPWPALLDPGSPPGSFSQQGGIGPVSRSYGLSLFPTFYIIDPSGKVAWRGDREQPDTLLLQKLHDVAGK